MEEKIGCFEKTVQRIIFILFALILLITAIQNIEFIFETMPAENIITLFVVMALFLVIVLLIKNIKLDIKKLVFAAVVVGFALRLLYALAVQTEPASDFKTLFAASRRVVQGNYGFLNGGYFTRWAYQIPFVFFQSLFLRIYDSVITLKLVNVLLMTGSCIFVYRIASCYVTDKAASIACIGYALYPAPILMSSVLTNQHASLFFILWGVDLFLSGKKWYIAVLSGVCLCIGNLLRSDGILVIIALLCLGLFYFVNYLVKREKSSFQIVWKTGLCAASFFLITNVITLLFILSPLGKNGIDNQYPEWKLLLGLNTETYGMYTETDVDILKIKDDETRWQEATDRINEYFKDISLGDFLSEKTRRMWAENETESWSMGHMDREREVVAGLSVQWFVNQIIAADKGIYLLMFILSCVSALLAILKKEHHWIFLLLSVLFIGNYLSYLLIEIQTRYRYFIMPFLFIIAAYAVEAIQSDSRTGKLLIQHFAGKTKIEKENNGEKYLNTDENESKQAVN